MATIGTITGSKLIGTPITVPVTAAVLSNVSFHRVLLEVTVTDHSGSSSTYKFATPVTSGETVMFDVSSALRAVADQFDYAAAVINPVGGTSYPSFSFVVKAWDEWMKDGEIRDNSASAAQSSLSGLYCGSLTDRERQTGHTPEKWSRKPDTSPEVVYVGHTHLVAGSFSAAPRVAPVNVQPDLELENAYVMFPPRDAYEMRFINSLGVHESVCVTCLRTTEVGFKTDRYVISRQETLSEFSRGMVVKRNDHERWKLSSGPLDNAWQQWWLHEVLMARHAWLYVGTPVYNSGAWYQNKGAWLQVHILPEETVSAVDRQKLSLMSVEFTVEFDINGSPFP